MVIKSKIISSLEKVFWDSDYNSFPEMKDISALRGERVSFQLLVQLTTEPNESGVRRDLTPKITGVPSEWITVRQVEQVPVDMTVWPEHYDGFYERNTPGFYPDILSPLRYDGKIISKSTMPTAIWIDVTIPADCDESGVNEIKIELWHGEDFAASATLALDIIPAKLPEQELIFTQWFHCDALAQYYDVEVWSEKHWQIIENFAKVAVKNGINLLLTPVFTPPLDTAIGGERLTTQLVDVTCEGGKWSFGYERLVRWIEMCDRIGVKYLEISHLFTQWGARHAPKIMATVNGEYRRVFGWDTDATGEEYVGFLRAFITDFLAFMKARGDDKRCFFHISDEPMLEHLEYYKAAKQSVADLLDGYVIMDALSNYDFWEKGIVDLPVPCNDHIKPFLENNVPGLWTYYCSAQCKDVSNRFIAMPSCRNRSIGMQMYKHDIVGFLHWGYNFYNNMQSYDAINPYVSSTGDFWVPAGDTYSVYPGPKGEALESLRIIVFHDALQDMSAMKMCESLYSKEEVVSEMEKVLGDPIAFDRCAKTPDVMLAIRARINEMIKAKM